MYSNYTRIHKSYFAYHLLLPLSQLIRVIYHAPFSSHSYLLNVISTPKSSLLITLHPVNGADLALTSPRTNIRPRKLPRSYPSLKKDIQLALRPASRFRKAEIRPQPAEEAHTSPYVANR